MNPKIKKMWVEALRRGYKQGHGALRDAEGRDEFCCLGVLCDLHAKATGNAWQSDKYLGYTALLPQAVVEWAELPSDNPRVNGTEITVPNDDGVTFPEIADLIEQHL